MENSLLVGNGIDIQLGGNDFLNKWIIVRLLSDAKAGKYDDLFASGTDAPPAIRGDEIVSLFLEMPSLGNRARNGDFDELINDLNETEISSALENFKNRYTWEIISPEHIGLEDWILLLRLYLQEQSDLLSQFNSLKQGFERMVLDAIYCNGTVQSLHKNVRKKAKEFFVSFDKAFTLNYDNSLEKITNKPVFHLHGGFETLALSENPQMASGFLRKRKGDTVYFPPKFQHCNCNAILDYSGDNKYRFAVALSSATEVFQKLKALYDNDRDGFDEYISAFSIEQQEIIRVGLEQNLPFGYNYHFGDLEQLTGELTIIGIAPQNDRHLFECINRSKLDRVVFYHFFVTDNGNAPIMPISKPYEVRNVSELWSSIGLQTSQPISKIAQDFQLKMMKNSVEVQEFVSIFNAFESEPNAVNAVDILQQLKSIPKETEKAIIKMMVSEMQKEKHHTSQKSEDELYKQFREFGRTLSIASLSPQTLYFMYIMSTSKTSVKRKRKK